MNYESFDMFHSMAFSLCCLLAILEYMLFRPFMREFLLRNREEIRISRREKRERERERERGRERDREREREI